MKVSKISTSSFAISRDAEHRIREMAAVDSKYGVNVTLTGKYAPLAKFKMTWREKVISGAINFLALKKTMYSEKSNFFYVNLANARLVYVSGKSRHGIELADVEFFERLLGLPSKTISALGLLLESGSTKKDEISEETLAELLSHGLAEEYVYETNLLVDYAMREVKDLIRSMPSTFSFEEYDYKDVEEIPWSKSQHRVRPAYRIPPFNSSTYNLSNFLEVDDTIEASYEKDSVKYSEEQVKGVLGTLFRGKADMIEIAYLPYFQYRTMEVGTGRQETHLLPCLKGKAKFAYTHPFKLKPVSIYSMGVGEKVVPVEGEVITFDDIADLKQAKDEIRRRIITPLKTGFSGQSGYELGGGILFYGPPGCGKTYLAKATVGEVGISFISANIEDIMGEGLDMAAGKLHDIFEYARSAAPCVLFFDEIDTIASRRDLYPFASIVNQLLTEMDGIAGLGKGIIIIGATNMPWRIDPALLRGGRFTEQIYLKPPDFESRVEIFEIHLKKNQDISPTVGARELASLTEFYSPADIKTIVDRAATIALESSLKSKFRRHRIQQWHFIQAIKERKSTLIPWFKYAEKQMEVEGAKESYPELWEDIQRFKNAVPSVGREEAHTPSLREMMDLWREEDRKMV